MKDIIKRYKTPPPLPKRTDSIARNIDKYFNTDLLKSGEAGEEKQDLEVIEHRILGDETEDNLTDDQVEDFEESKFVTLTFNQTINLIFLIGDPSDPLKRTTM